MRLRVAILLALVVALVAAPSALAAKTPTRPSYLFAMTSTGGALKHDTSGWWLELMGTSPLVTRFTDRPNRLASTLSPAQLAAQWRTYGFPSDPPNAALVLDGRPADADVFVIELRRPSVSGSTVRFRAKPVHDTSSALSRYAKRADRLRESRFASASLFIDDGASTVYEPVIFTVSGLEPGESVRISLTSNGVPIGFSTGPQSQQSAGIAVQALSGPLPVSALLVNPSTISIVSSASGGGGGSVTFTFSVYLAADEDVETFYLAATGDWGATVAAQVGSSMATTVNQTSTLFSWYAY